MGKDCCGQKDGNYCDQKAGNCCDKDETPVGEIIKVSTRLDLSDWIGSAGVRCGLNRSNYRINPGLYCVGSPGAESPVLVTANYKLTFDSLRKELSDLSAWILVLDTKGVNVWCSAGKGTFGTDEVLRKIEKVQLKDLVSHRTIILPQLAAPGVSAHEVLRQSGFKVVYGPVRAKDILNFIRSGMQKTQEMSTVRFNLMDRLILTPAELSYILKPILVLLGIAIVLELIGIDSRAFGGFVPYIGAILVGNFIVPALLPWIPGRPFALKGWLIGLVYALILILTHESIGWQLILSYLLIIPPITAFIALNFTGSSTYTSLSGVRKETKVALPFILVSLISGILFTIVTMVMFHN